MENLKIKIEELREKLLNGQEHLIDTKALEDLSINYKTSLDANGLMFCDVWSEPSFKDRDCSPFRDQWHNY